MLKWTERLMSTSQITPEIESDAWSTERCLYAEATQVLRDEGIWVSWNDIDALVSPAVRQGAVSLAGTLPGGGSFPYFLGMGRLDWALDLCHAVEDALMAIKREKGVAP